MKKRSIKHLSLGKKTISTLENNVFGGAPTTNQSQYCPQDPITLLPKPHSLNPVDCLKGSLNTVCSLCVCN